MQKEEAVAVGKDSQTTQGEEGGVDFSLPGTPALV